LPVISISNQKGGVGKTATALNLSAALAASGRRVLMIDLDPQASLTTTCGIDPNTLETSIYHVIHGSLPLQDVIRPTSFGADLAPSSIDLSLAEIELVNEMAREMLVKSALDEVRGQYDFVILDCQPGLTLLTINAWTASDHILIPVSDFLAVKGLKLLFDSIARTRQRLNKSLRILGVLLTRTSPRTSHSQIVREGLKNALNGKVHIFETQIKESTRFKESMMYSQPMLSYEPRHEGALAYQALAEEIMAEVVAHA
jgi:chromosome partitioning protein